MEHYRIALQKYVGKEKEHSSGLVNEVLLCCSFCITFQSLFQCYQSDFVQRDVRQIPKIIQELPYMRQIGTRQVSRNCQASYQIARVPNQC